MTRSSATLQKIKYDKNYYNSTMKVFERRKNISRLACKYLSLINDVVERNNPELERMLDLHKKIFNLNEENGYHFENPGHSRSLVTVEYLNLKPFLKIELEKMYRKIGPTRDECKIHKNEFQRG